METQPHLLNCIRWANASASRAPDLRPVRKKETEPAPPLSKEAVSTLAPAFLALPPSTPTDGSEEQYRWNPPPTKSPDGIYVPEVLRKLPKRRMVL